MKKVALAVALWLLPCAAFAQSTPGLVYGQIPTAAQWNSYFAAKQDNLGYVPLNSAGGTMFGPLITAPSASTGTGFNIAPGAAPGSPNNGDLWATSSGLFARIGGSTIQLTGAGAGSFTSTFPVVASFPSAGIVNYALNFNSSLVLDGSNNLGINLAHANIWTATQTFPNNSLTLAEFPTIGANTVLGSIAGGTPAALSQTQLTSLCNVFTTTINGCVPNPGTIAGKVLSDNGTWIAAAGTGTVTNVDTAGLATGGPISTTGTVTVTAAVKSDQTTATSTSVAVVPAVQQFHPSATKAWLTVSTTTGNCPSNVCAFTGYNIASVTRTGTGAVTVAFTTSFTSSAYSCHVSAVNPVSAFLGTKATGSIGLVAAQSGTATDTTLDMDCDGTQ